MAGGADPKALTGGRPVIDCDIHAVPASIADLEPYLEEHWREYIATSQFKGPTDPTYPANMPTSRDPALEPVDGRPPGTTLASVRQHVLDPWGTEIGILNCAYGVDGVRNPDVAVTLARAVNDWLAERWLDPEPRLRASIVVASQDPAAAAAEIERRAGDPRFVQVLLPVRSAIPYGSRLHDATFAAAVRHGLPVCLHFGGAPGLPPTASGWPTYYIEDYVDMASAFQSQLTSLIAEGVFDRHPALTVVLAESGFGWLPGFLWRFDKGWRGLRREIPWSKRLPSEYVHEHVRVTLQPIDGPPEVERLLPLMEQLHAADMLMFSTDYPHLHFGDPADALPRGIEGEQLDRILAANARAVYRFPEADRHA